MEHAVPALAPHVKENKSLQTELCLVLYKSTCDSLANQQLRHKV